MPKKYPNGPAVVQRALDLAVVRTDHPIAIIAIIIAETAKHYGYSVSSFTKAVLSTLEGKS